jgi:hypothetical protein
LLFASEKSWWEILLIHISFKSGEWDVSVGVVPLLILFWIGAESVRALQHWRQSQRPPQE